MFDDNILDFHGWPMDLSYERLVSKNHNIEISKVTSTTPYNVGQVLRKPNKFNQSDFSLFLIENIRLLVIILIGFISTLSAKFTLLKLIKRRFSLYHLLTNGTRLGSISFKLGSVTLAFSFFLFFNLNMLTNMIKTEKVTVSTNEFLDSISKLNRTTKPVVTVYTDTMALFYRLFKKRKRNDDLIAMDYSKNLQDFFSMISKHEFDNHFYFMGEIFYLYFIYYGSLLNRSVDYIVFHKPTIYFETLRTIFYRKNLDKKMKQILNRR